MVGSATAVLLPESQAVLPARERRLLYVVMTRARDELMVTWVGRPSPLLAKVLM